MNPEHHADASRREFLRTASTVLGAGVLAAAASSAIGVPSRPAQVVSPIPPVEADAKTLRIGVIGLGADGACAMGLNHARSMISYAGQGREKVEIKAICDLCTIHLDKAKADIDKAQGGDVAAYTKSEELLARDDIDGVIIAVPEHAHAAVAIQALRAGKDIYLEKPMTLNLDHAMALADEAAKRPSRIVQIGTQMTRVPKFHEARRLIKEGLIGTPTISQTSYCRNSKKGEWHYPINPEWKPGVNLDWERWCAPLGPMEWDPKVYYQWRRYRKTSTGIVGDLLVHVMTPMMFAIDQGWPVRVSAGGQHLVDKAMENHDTISIVAEFETGHQMIVTGSTNNEVGLETLIRGHRGNIYLGGRHCEFRPERIYSEEVEPVKVECPDIGNDQDVHRLGWLRSLRTREKPDSDVELGLKVMVVVDLATRSMWEGGAFRFDPSTRKVSRA